MPSKVANTIWHLQPLKSKTVRSISGVGSGSKKSLKTRRVRGVSSPSEFGPSQLLPQEAKLSTGSESESERGCELGWWGVAGLELVARWILALVVAVVIVLVGSTVKHWRFTSDSGSIGGLPICRLRVMDDGDFAIGSW
jgi:hypothetical protein